MGAIYTQTNQQGEHTIIAYANWKVNGTFCRISQGPPVHLFHRPPTPGETGTSSSQNPQPAVRCHAAIQFPDSLQDELRDAHRLPFPQCSGCNPLADKPDFSGTGSRPTHTGPEPIPNTQNYQLPRTSRNSWGIDSSGARSNDKTNPPWLYCSSPGAWFWRFCKTSTGTNLPTLGPRKGPQVLLLGWDGCWHCYSPPKLPMMPPLSTVATVTPVLIAHLWQLVLNIDKNFDEYMPIHKRRNFGIKTIWLNFLKRSVLLTNFIFFVTI